MVVLSCRGLPWGSHTRAPRKDESRVKTPALILPAGASREFPPVCAVVPRIVGNAVGAGAQLVRAGGS